MHMDSLGWPLYDETIFFEIIRSDPPRWFHFIKKYYVQSLIKKILISRGRSTPSKFSHRRIVFVTEVDPQ